VLVESQITGKSIELVSRKVAYIDLEVFAILSNSDTFPAPVPVFVNLTLTLINSISKIIPFFSKL
jgi:hypothetical protein